MIPLSIALLKPPLCSRRHFASNEPQYKPMPRNPSQHALLAPHDICSRRSLPAVWTISKPESVSTNQWLPDTCVPKVRVDALHSMYSQSSTDLLYRYRNQQLFHQSDCSCMLAVQKPWLHTTHPSPSIAWVFWPLWENPWARIIPEQSLVQESRRQKLQHSLYHLQEK